MDKEFQSNTFREFLNFLDNFPLKGEDDVSIILKGHLLIEELLISFVSKKTKRPKELKNFKFYHYLCLAKALDETHHKNWIWEAIEILNTIRNKLAHNLKPAGLEALKKEFIKIVRSRSGKKAFPESLVNDFGEFKMAVMTLHLSLAIQLHFEYKSLKIPTLLSG